MRVRPQNALVYQVDDRARGLGRQLRREFLGQQQWRAQVDRHGAIEIFRAERIGFVRLENRGVVDEAVQPAECARGAAYEAAGFEFIGEVGGDRRRPAAATADFGGKRLRLRKGSGARMNYHGGAVPGQALGDGASDPPCPAGHKNEPVFPPILRHLVP